MMFIHLKYSTDYDRRFSPDLQNQILDLQAKKIGFKACAVQLFPAREDELPNSGIVVQEGRY
jgi:hypothetical protein